MDRGYIIIIRYSLIFTGLIFISGVWLFVLAQSSEVDEKSLESVLEVAVPHLLAMSVLVFVLCHFLLFIDKVDKKRALKFSIFLYILVILQNISNLKAYVIFFMGISFIWLVYQLWVNSYKE